MAGVLPALSLIVCSSTQLVMGAPLNVLDMSHVIDENVQYWKPQKKPSLTPVFNDSFGWHVNNVCSGEHVGTHIDAPDHMKFDHPLQQLHEIPLENLFGPAVSIDVRDNIARLNVTNYTISLADLEQHEAVHGTIPDGALVFSCTGWADKYGVAVQNYWGTSDPRVERPWSFSFPGFGGKAAEWLVQQRNIRGLATDTPSCDVWPNEGNPVHYAVLSRNKICMEHVARTCDLPRTGATVYAFPIKMKGSSGMPVRVVATWGRSEVVEGNGGSPLARAQGIVILMCLAGLMN